MLVGSKSTEEQQQTNADRDHRHRVNEAEHDKQLRAQHRQKFWLACNTFEEFTAKYTHTDRGADSAETQHESTGYV